MPSSLILNLGHTLAVLIVISLALLMIAIVVLRVWYLLREQRQRRLDRQWRELIIGAMYSMPEQLPAIADSDRLFFLALWNQLRGEYHEGKAEKKALREMLIKSGALETARALCRKRGFRPRLIAIITLGYMEDATQWDVLKQYAYSSEPLLSLVACHALIRINKHEALPLFLPLIAAHPEWPHAKIGGLLLELGPDLISQPFTELVAQAPPDIQPGLVRHLVACHATLALPLVRRLMQEAADDHILGPTLQVIAKFRMAEDLPLVRTYLTHPRWHVRAQAAAALGRMGDASDAGRLQTLLSDPQWWVRYRAAQALACLPAITPAELQRIKDTQEDHYGRDMLARIMFEAQWGVTKC